MINQFHVDALINTGIVGSIDTDIKHLYTVISKDIGYFDVREEQLESYYGFKVYFKADEKIINLALSTQSNSSSTYIGRIMSGDNFICNTQVKDSIKNNSNALCVEMEEAAIAHTAFVNNIPFIIICSISDMADNASTEDYASLSKKRLTYLLI